MEFRVDRLTSTIWSAEDTNTPSDSLFDSDQPPRRTSADGKVSTFDRYDGTLLVKGTRYTSQVIMRPPLPGEDLRPIRWAWRVLSAEDIYANWKDEERAIYATEVRHRLCVAQVSGHVDGLEEAVERGVTARLFKIVADKADAGTLSQEEFDRYAPWVGGAGWLGESIEAADDALAIGEPEPDVNFDQWLN